MLKVKDGILQRFYVKIIKNNRRSQLNKYSFECIMISYNVYVTKSEFNASTQQKYTNHKL